MKRIKSLYNSLDWKANPWYYKPLEIFVFLLDIIEHCILNIHSYDDGKCVWCDHTRKK